MYKTIKLGNTTETPDTMEKIRSLGRWEMNHFMHGMGYRLNERGEQGLRIDGFGFQKCTERAIWLYVSIN